MMINLTNFDTSIRGGPGSFGGQLAEGETGGFDMLFGALDQEPSGVPPEGESPFPDEDAANLTVSGFAFAAFTPQPVSTSSSDTKPSNSAPTDFTLAAPKGLPAEGEFTAVNPVLSEFVPQDSSAVPQVIPSDLDGIAESAGPKADPDVLPAEKQAPPGGPDVLWEGFETKTETKTKGDSETKVPEIPVITQQDPRRLAQMPQMAAAAFQLNRSNRNLTPALIRHSDHVPAGTFDGKGELPVVITPPIIVPPRENRMIGPPIQVGFKGFQDVALNEIDAPAPVKPVAGNPAQSEVSGFAEPPQSVFHTQEFISPEDALLPLSEGKIAGKAVLEEKPKMEAGRIAEAIFDKFAINANKAIRHADFEIPIDAEPVVEQLGKPIMEITEGLLEDGEPVILKFRLKPAELGNVEIRLERNAAGKLNIAIQTENEPASRILHESFQQLRESLKDSGWQVNDLNVLTRSSLANSFNQQHGGNENFREHSAAHRSDRDDLNRESLTEPETENDSTERLVSLRA